MLFWRSKEDRDGWGWLGVNYDTEQMPASLTVCGLQPQSAASPVHLSDRCWQRQQVIWKPSIDASRDAHGYAAPGPLSDISCQISCCCSSPAMGDIPPLECGKYVLQYRAILHTRAANHDYPSSFSTWQPFLWYGGNIYFYGICAVPSGLVSDNYAAWEKLSLLLISQLALKECFASLKPGWGVIFFPLHLHTLSLCRFNRLFSCQTRLIQDIW